MVTHDNQYRVVQVPIQMEPLDPLGEVIVGQVQQVEAAVRVLCVEHERELGLVGIHRVEVFDVVHHDLGDERKSNSFFTFICLTLLLFNLFYFLYFTLILFFYFNLFLFTLVYFYLLYFYLFYYYFFYRNAPQAIFFHFELVSSI